MKDIPHVHIVAIDDWVGDFFQEDGPKVMRAEREEEFDTYEDALAHATGGDPELVIYTVIIERPQGGFVTYCFSE